MVSADGARRSDHISLGQYSGGPEEGEHPEQARALSRYLKTSSLEFIGLKLPAIDAVVRRHSRGMPPDGLLALMQGLWSVRIYEVKRAAVDVLQTFAVRGDPLTGVGACLTGLTMWTQWAIVDPMCTSGLGKLVLRSAEAENRVVEWKRHSRFWRRATILPYLYMSLKQNFREEHTSRVLDALRPHLQDREFFVAKAVGWVLRELSKRDPNAVSAFIKENRESMTALAIREGSRRLLRPL